MSTVCGVACVSKTTVVDQLHMFWISMQHIRHKSSLGQAHTIANPENTARVENAMHKGRHLEHLFPVRWIEYEQEHCKRNHSRFWISQDTFPGGPRLLTGTHKKQSKSVSLEYLQQNHTEHTTFLACIVTRMRQGASIYNHIKPGGMPRKHSTSPQLKKSKSQASAIKDMLTAFFDI